MPSEKSCSRCGETKKSSMFYRQMAKADGLASSCKKCLYGAKNSKRSATEVLVPTVSEKWCPACLDFLPAASFSKNRRSKSGLWTYCRSCEKDRKDEMRGRIG